MWKATFENWESEFLRVGAFVVLTTMLVQKGLLCLRCADHSGTLRQPATPRRMNDHATRLAILELELDKERNTASALRHSVESELSRVEQQRKTAVLGTAMAKKRAATAKKKTAKRKTAKRRAAKRTLIDTGTDKRYVRRRRRGQFAESDDVGRAAKADPRRRAKTKAKRGQGDRGDR